jgi:hypothetical protein
MSSSASSIVENPSSFMETSKKIIIAIPNQVKDF